MQYFNGSLFFTLLVGATEVDAGTRVWKKVVPGSDQATDPVTAEEASRFRKVISKVRPECVAVGFHSAADGLTRIDEALQRSKMISTAELLELYAEVGRRLHDDASRCKLIRVSPDAAHLLDNPRDGWEDVIDRFVDAAIDIEEMQKCRALERYAAAVFHSVQVVEVGLLSLGRFIEVSDPLSGWTAVSSKLKKIMETKYHDRTAKEQAHGSFLEQVQGTVEALKNAWRNKISHAHGKSYLMRTDFTPEIAEEIIMATRAFMRRLATEMPS